MLRDTCNARAHSLAHVVETGRLKMQDRKMTDRKMTDKSAGLENAGLENDGQKCNTQNALIDH